ncbi:MAG TPA: hypothetical protein VIL36_17690 [Acidimicrobiales bacterium]
MIACTLHALAGPALITGAFTVLAVAYRPRRHQPATSVRAAASHVTIIRPPATPAEARLALAAANDGHPGAAPIYDQDTEGERP